MRILITGGTGFIGYNLVPILQDANHEVVCLVRETSNLRWLDSIGNIEYRYGDILDPESLGAAMQDVDCVVHMAGAVVTIRPEDFFRINHLGTRNVVEAASRQSSTVSRLIMVSSLSAAGPSDRNQPKSESAPNNPVSNYGKSKLAAERAVLDFQDRMQVGIMRPPIVYGPKDVGVQGFFQLVQRGWQVKFMGKNPLLSMVYVTDLARALSLLTTAEYPSGSLYYVADPAIYSVPDIQDIIAGAVGVDTRTIALPKSLLYPVATIADLVARLRNKPSFLNLDKIREIAQPAWTCSSEKIARDLNFHAQYHLAEGAAETVEWYRIHGWL